jgi:hypothetical protein
MIGTRLEVNVHIVTSSDNRDPDHRHGSQSMWAVG